MKVRDRSKKLNCRDGNSQCGAKCQPKDYRCPSEKGFEAVETLEKFSKLVSGAENAFAKSIEIRVKAYKDIFADSTKKRRRAEIAGKPNEKSLKKQILKEEEKAWVFTVLAKEYGKSSENSELKDLIEGYVNGDEKKIAEAIKYVRDGMAKRKEKKVESGVAKEIEAVVEKIEEVESAAVPAAVPALAVVPSSTASPSAAEDVDVVEVEPKVEEVEVEIESAPAQVPAVAQTAMVPAVVPAAVSDSYLEKVLKDFDMSRELYEGLDMTEEEFYKFMGVPAPPKAEKAEEPKVPKAEYVPIAAPVFERDESKKAAVVKSYKELSKSEIEVLKDKNSDRAKKMDLLLTDEGRKELEEIDRLEASLENHPEYGMSIILAKAKFDYEYKIRLEGDDEIVPLAKIQKIRHVTGEASLQDVQKNKIEPIKELLRQKLLVAKEYNELPKKDERKADPYWKERAELGERWNALNAEISKYMFPDYEDGTGNIVSEHDVLFEFGLRGYKKNARERIDGDLLTSVASRMDLAKWNADKVRKELSDGIITQEEADKALRDIAKDDPMSFFEKPSYGGYSEKEMAEIDSKYEEYLEKRGDIGRSITEERERLGIPQRIVSFNKRFAMGLAGKSEKDDNSKNERRGKVSPNIEQRNLPVGDPSSNPEEEVLQRIIDERAPMMAITPEALKKLFAGDGEFKNVFDFTNKNGIAGKLTAKEFEKYKQERKLKEFEAFRVPLSAEAEARPVYGFMGNFEDLRFMAEEVRPYGEIIIQFKPEVKDDITVTIDDSMGGEAPNQKGSPANKVSKQSMPNREAAKVNLNAKDHRNILAPGSRGAYREPRYIEWQGGGRLRIDNIDKINFPLEIYLNLPKKLLAQLEAAGIEIVIFGILPN